MRQYAYFPGCSLEKIALSYNQSTKETAKKLDVELKELEDWNCCGATAYFHVDEILAYTLCARNLAMAEKENLDLVAPCSACYKNSFFTNHVGMEEISERVSQPLKDLRVAPYYGCQIVRPRKDGEEIEQPDFFENLLSAMGADPVDFALKTRCCGGSLLISSREAALDTTLSNQSGVLSEPSQPRVWDEFLRPRRLLHPALGAGFRNPKQTFRHRVRTDQGNAACAVCKEVRRERSHEAHYTCT